MSGRVVICGLYREMCCLVRRVAAAAALQIQKRRRADDVHR